MNESAQKYKVKDAARDLKLEPETIRIGLREGKFPWGTAIKPRKRWIYIIYPEAYERLVKGVRA